ncbi:AraC family transcriptional regulator [Dysgonomonas sp. BGC7]|uniref:helix-turn-helix domain-containing protein n=1 Tax=Dysgonomonas sp. BGC7 TaxID=1658008 RepID=UPI0006816394|nr:AraC family transcriptional regulator [Dysgonomonas sp. BGC7]MBD8388462.1 helix-turn-helix transcriptional regulator [Dysgonomonas sp. BGC7]
MGDNLSQFNEINFLIRDDSFSLHEEKKDNQLIVGNQSYNCIIFMLSGNIEIVTSANRTIILEPDHMYNLSMLTGPYKGKVLKDARYINLNTSALVPLINAIKLQNLIDSSHLISKEVETLKFGEVLYSYLQHIILLKKDEDIPVEMYDLKKLEFLYYMRQYHTREELAHFLHASISTHSKFRMIVYKNYTNSTTVKELSNRCYMTTKTFTRHFKTEFGVTPHKWLIKQKIDNLNDLLFNKGASIEDILEEFRFSSIIEFRQFCIRYHLDNILESFKQLKEAYLENITD